MKLARANFANEYKLGCVDVRGGVIGLPEGPACNVGAGAMQSSDATGRGTALLHL